MVYDQGQMFEDAYKDGRVINVNAIYDAMGDGAPDSEDPDEPYFESGNPKAYVVEYDDTRNVPTLPRFTGVPSRTFNFSKSAGQTALDALYQEYQVGLVPPQGYICSADRVDLKNGKCMLKTHFSTGAGYATMGDRAACIGGSGQQQSAVTTQACGTTTATQFIYDSDGKTLKHNGSGLCVTVASNPSVGSPVTLATCNGEQGQWWEYFLTSRQFKYKVLPLADDPNLCLQSSGSGAGVVLATCDPLNPVQQWIDPVTGSGILEAAKPEVQVQQSAVPATAGSWLGPFDGTVVDVPWDADNKDLLPSDVLWGFVPEQASRSIFSKVYHQTLFSTGKLIEYENQMPEYWSPIFKSSFKLTSFLQRDLCLFPKGATGNAPASVQGVFSSAAATVGIEAADTPLVAMPCSAGTGEFIFNDNEQLVYGGGFQSGARCVELKGGQAILTTCQDKPEQKWVYDYLTERIGWKGGAMNGDKPAQCLYLSSPSPGTVAAVAPCTEGTMTDGASNQRWFQKNTLGQFEQMGIQTMEGLIIVGGNMALDRVPQAPRKIVDTFRAGVNKAKALQNNLFRASTKATKQRVGYHLVGKIGRGKVLRDAIRGAAAAFKRAFQKRISAFIARFVTQSTAVKVAATTAAAGANAGATGAIAGSVVLPFLAPIASFCVQIATALTAMVIALQGIMAAADILCMFLNVLVPPILDNIMEPNGICPDGSKPLETFLPDELYFFIANFVPVLGDVIDVFNPYVCINESGAPVPKQKLKTQPYFVDTSLSLAQHDWGPAQYPRGSKLLPSFTAGVPEGMEQCSGALCYGKCPEGYEKHFDESVVCWKGARARGWGVIPKTAECDAGERDDGLSCWKDVDANGIVGCLNPFNWGDGGKCYVRGGYITKNLFQRLSCEQGKELDGLLCYTVCNANETGKGPLCWAKDGTDAAAVPRTVKWRGNNRRYDRGYNPPALENLGMTVDWCNFTNPQMIDRMGQFYYDQAMANPVVLADGRYEVKYITQFLGVIASSEYSCDVVCMMKTMRFNPITGGEYEEQFGCSYEDDPLNKFCYRRFYFAKMDKDPQGIFTVTGCTNSDYTALDAMVPSYTIVNGVYKPNQGQDYVTSLPKVFDFVEKGGLTGTNLSDAIATGIAVNFLGMLPAVAAMVPAVRRRFPRMSQSSAVLTGATMPVVNTLFAPVMDKLHTELEMKEYPAQCPLVDGSPVDTCIKGSREAGYYIVTNTDNYAIGRGPIVEQTPGIIPYISYCNKAILSNDVCIHKDVLRETIEAYETQTGRRVKQVNQIEARGLAGPIGSPQGCFYKWLETSYDPNENKEGTDLIEKEVLVPYEILKNNESSRGDNRRTCTFTPKPALDLASPYTFLSEFAQYDIRKFVIPTTKEVLFPTRRKLTDSTGRDNFVPTFPLTPFVLPRPLPPSTTLGDKNTCPYSKCEDLEQIKQLVNDFNAARTDRKIMKVLRAWTPSANRCDYEVEMLRITTTAAEGSTAKTSIFKKETVSIGVELIPESRGAQRCRLDQELLGDGNCYDVCPPGYDTKGVDCVARYKPVEIPRQYVNPLPRNPSCPAGYTLGLAACRGKCPTGYTEEGDWCNPVAQPSKGGVCPPQAPNLIESQCYANSMAIPVVPFLYTNPLQTSTMVTAMTGPGNFIGTSNMDGTRTMTMTGGFTKDWRSAMYASFGAEQPILVPSSSEFTISFTVDTSKQAVMLAGLVTTAAAGTNDYMTAMFGPFIGTFYFNTTNRLFQVINENNTISFDGAFTSTSVFTIEFDGRTVRYKKDGNIIYNAPDQAPLLSSGFYFAFSGFASEASIIVNNFALQPKSAMVTAVAGAAGGYTATDNTDGTKSLTMIAGFTYNWSTAMYASFEAGQPIRVPSGSTFIVNFTPDLSKPGTMLAGLVTTAWAGTNPFMTAMFGPFRGVFNLDTAQAKYQVLEPKGTAIEATPFTSTTMFSIEFDGLGVTYKRDGALIYYSTDEVAALNDGFYFAFSGFASVCSIAINTFTVTTGVACPSGSTPVEGACYKTCESYQDLSGEMNCANKASFNRSIKGFPEAKGCLFRRIIDQSDNTNSGTFVQANTPYPYKPGTLDGILTSDSKLSAVQADVTRLASSVTQMDTESKLRDPAGNARTAAAAVLETVAKQQPFTAFPDLTCQSPRAMNLFINAYENENDPKIPFAAEKRSVKRILKAGMSAPNTCDFLFEELYEFYEDILYRPTESSTGVRVGRATFTQGLDVNDATVLVLDELDSNPDISGSFVVKAGSTAVTPPYAATPCKLNCLDRNNLVAIKNYLDEQGTTDTMTSNYKQVTMSYRAGYGTCDYQFIKDVVETDELTGLETVENDIETYVRATFTVAPTATSDVCVAVPETVEEMDVRLFDIEEVDPQTGEPIYTLNGERVEVSPLVTYDSSNPSSKVVMKIVDL